MRVAIYIRVSRIDLNPENQKLELVEHAKRMGWDYEIFEETESTRKTRPVKNEVFKNACSGKYQTIFVYKLDRWCRSLQELVNDFSILSQKKVGFVSFKDNIILNEDPRNMLMVQMLGAFAEFERAMIRERTMAGLARARAQGKKLGRPRISPYHKRKVIELYKELGSITAVSKRLQIGYGTVYRTIKESIQKHPQENPKEKEAK